MLHEYNTIKFSENTGNPPTKKKEKKNYIWKMGSTVKNECSRHLETNQLICYVNQLTGGRNGKCKVFKSNCENSF